MPNINRRAIIAFASALMPGFFLSKIGSAQALSFDQASATALGVKIIKSSGVKVGQSKVFTSKSSGGKTIQVVLTRTATGLFALDGACTHQGCAVASQENKLVCPCHGSVFASDSGAPLMGPSGSDKSSLKPLLKYKVTEKSGFIYIK